MGIENIVLPKDFYNSKKVPCKICGELTDMTNVKLCDCCWEVIQRLDGFLSNKNGRKYTREKLKEFGAEEMECENCSQCG